MKTTIELLHAAQAGRTDVELARLLQLPRSSNISNWTQKGRVSPEGAAALAQLLGEPVVEWIAIAAAEALPEPRRKWLLRKLTALFVSGVAGLTIWATPYTADAKPLDRIQIMCSRRYLLNLA